MAYTTSRSNDFTGWNNGTGTNIAIQSNDSNSNTYKNNIFNDTKDFKDVTGYTLMRGVPDFGSLVQFNPYETGYATFFICQMPKFIEALARNNTGYNKLVQNWKHIIEYEFKSFDGLQGIESDTVQLGDDLNSINVINKVNMQSASEFTLSYDEKSGSPLTKFAKLYLTGIKDPRTQVKTYHGLIKDGLMEPGFENEVFTFLFIATDNTMREVEAAYLIICGQLTSADTDMYNYTKGDIGKKEVQVKFNGYPIQSVQINKVAKDFLTFIQSDTAINSGIGMQVNSMEFNYTGTDAVRKTLKNYGASDEVYTSLKEHDTGLINASKFYKDSLDDTITTKDEYASGQ